MPDMYCLIWRTTNCDLYLHSITPNMCTTWCLSRDDAMWLQLDRANITINVVKSLEGDLQIEVERICL